MKCMIKGSSQGLRSLGSRAKTTTAAQGPVESSSPKVQERKSRPAWPAWKAKAASFGAAVDFKAQLRPPRAAQDHHHSPLRAPCRPRGSQGRTRSCSRPRFGACKSACRLAFAGVWRQAAGQYARNHTSMPQNRLETRGDAAKRPATAPSKMALSPREAWPRCCGCCKPIGNIIKAFKLENLDLNVNVKHL